MRGKASIEEMLPLAAWGEVMKFWLTGGVGGGEYPITWEGLYILLTNAQLSEVAKGLEIAVSAAVTS